MRKVRKVATNARRQGQPRGQLSVLAAKHHVSTKWLRLISEGALDDPVFVEAIREAAKTPELWKLVAPRALEALALPTLKARLLGWSVDDLLAMLHMENLRLLADQNVSRRISALEDVNQLLDLHLRDQRDALIALGRRNVDSTGKANEKKTSKADQRAREYLRQIESMNHLTERSACRLIAKDEELTMVAVQQRIKRYRKRHPAQESRIALQ